MNTATPRPEPIDTGDRLGFTFFLAVALHALLILGVTFKSDFTAKPPPTLEITLATQQSDHSPEEAEHLAQFNQEASGSSDTNQLLTTDRLAPIDASLIRESQPALQRRRIDTAPPVPAAPITTVSASQFKASLHQAPTDQQQTPQDGADQRDTLPSEEIASLRARLDRQRRASAKKPRIRRLTSVATRASADAAYLNRWTSKVEQVGNRNFPTEAIDQKIYGKLRLAASVRSNGSVHRIEILQSSGYAVLDEAAVQIVRLAAPFPEFPFELRKDVDVLEIIRTWHFELTGLSTSASGN